MTSPSVATSSLSSAIADALALNPTEDNPVLIQLAPGLYTVDDENALPATNLKSRDTVAAIADRGSPAGGSPASLATAASPFPKGGEGDFGAGAAGPADAGRTNVERPTSNVTPDSIKFQASNPVQRPTSNVTPAIWHLSLRHIYFAGAGPECTRIVCDRIIVDPDTITGFRDLHLDAVVELGDSFLPVHNVQVRDVEMRGGQLDGLWRDAAGAAHLSRLSAETGSTDELPRRHEDTKVPDWWRWYVDEKISNVAAQVSRIKDQGSRINVCRARSRRHQHLRLEERRHHDWQFVLSKRQHNWLHAPNTRE